MNKALLLSIVSMIGVIGLSIGAALIAVPNGVGAGTDVLPMFFAMVVGGLICMLVFQRNFRLYREGR